MKSFDIKEILSSQPGPVLKFFNPAKPVTVRCNASKNGLGAVLIQEEQLIVYASRSLSEAETRYAQIEKELLSVLFALGRFKVYTYGVKVLVENDHEPLEMHFEKISARRPTTFPKNATEIAEVRLCNQAQARKRSGCC